MVKSSTLQNALRAVAKGPLSNPRLYLTRVLLRLATGDPCGNGGDFFADSLLALHNRPNCGQNQEGSIAMGRLSNLGCSLILSACISLGLTTLARSACDANTDVASDCLDNVTEAAKDVVGAGDDATKSESVGEAVGNCIKCAAESLSDKVQQLGAEQTQQE
ncbi:hypothetical protein [Mesorhizobium sp. STM 4661]|uniref:hypothetical protein n=1 Tax=Mesorhizobium sp. STM 4661 TaxID=1297570 RepID=UPI0002BE045A|nr:hypothetical protein [Mesorhizobium sp. STM 4661]CCV11266.1 hypothetical protein MESS4_310003 [Mesorhizobium sp. STM 4661]